MKASRIIGFLGIFVFVTLSVYITIKNGSGIFAYQDIDGNFHEGKTLWDWFELIVVPISLAVVGIWFQNLQKKRDLEREYDAILSLYIQEIDTLVEKGLRESKPKDPIRASARAKTLTTLSRLDGRRKGILIRFIYELGIISNENNPAEKGNPIIPLEGADLRGCIFDFGNHVMVKNERSNRSNLRQTLFFNIDLSNTDLSNSNIRNVTFFRSNFNNVNFLHSSFDTAVFYESNLDFSIFSHSTLRASFMDSSMISADFSDSDLRNSGFTCCKTYFGELIDNSNTEDGIPITHRAIFTRANLQNTDLTGCAVFPFQLENARSLKNAIMPNETRYDGKFSFYKVESSTLQEGKIAKEDESYPSDELEIIKLRAFCECGMQIQNLSEGNSSGGFWAGLLKHRIRYHGHKIKDPFNRDIAFKRKWIDED